MKSYRKLIASLLIAIMIVGNLPSAAFASNETEDAYQQQLAQQAAEMQAAQDEAAMKAQEEAAKQQEAIDAASSQQEEAWENVDEAANPGSTEKKNNSPAAGKEETAPAAQESSGKSVQNVSYPARTFDDVKLGDGAVLSVSAPEGALTADAKINVKALNEKEADAANSVLKDTLKEKYAGSKVYEITFSEGGVLAAPRKDVTFVFKGLKTGGEKAGLYVFRGSKAELIAGPVDVKDGKAGDIKAKTTDIGTFAVAAQNEESVTKDVSNAEKAKGIADISSDKLKSHVNNTYTGIIKSGEGSVDKSEDAEKSETEVPETEKTETERSETEVPETDESEIETPATKFPAFKEAKRISGTSMKVRADAPEGAFPEGIQLYAAVVNTPQNILDAIDENSEEKIEQEDVLSIDVHFFLPDDPDTEIEPLIPINLTFRNIDLDAETVDVYHEDEKIAQVEGEGGSLTLDEFSVYSFVRTDNGEGGSWSEYKAFNIDIKPDENGTASVYPHITLDGTDLVDADYSNFTYSVTDTDVISIGEDGKISPLKPGKTSVSATPKVADSLPVSFFVTNYSVVKYNANGGEGVIPDNEEYAGGSEDPTAADGAGLTKTGHQFMGWSSDPDAVTPEYEAGDPLKTLMSNITSSSDPDSWVKTLYAVWLPEKVDVTITKLWVDEDDAAGDRPDSIGITLMNNGEVVKESRNLRTGADGEQSITFKGVDRFDAGGNLIDYYVEEGEVENYTASITKEPVDAEGNYSFTITNTYRQEKTNVVVYKEWDDAGNKDGKRPEEVRFTLLANGVAYKAQTLNTSGSFQYLAFRDLPRYKGGEEINYTVVEESIENYTTTIRPRTYEDFELEVPKGDRDKIIRQIGDHPIQFFFVSNKYTPGIRSISVVKKWDDDGNRDGIRPEKIAFDITGTVYDPEGEGEKEVVEIRHYLSEKNGWTAIFDVPVYDDQQNIDYSVEETGYYIHDEEDAELIEGIPEGYEVSYSNLADSGAFTIKNTHIPETVSIEVQKIWSDQNDWDGMRPGSIKVRLTANGTVVPGKELELNSSQVKENDDIWIGYFRNLPVYENGEIIEYSVLEDVPEGYRAFYTSADLNSYVEPEPDFDYEGPMITVINYHSMETTSLTASKVWDDADDQDGLREKAAEGLRLELRAYVNGEQEDVLSPIIEETIEQIKALRQIIEGSDDFESEDVKQELLDNIDSILDELRNMLSDPGMGVSLDSLDEGNDFTHQWDGLPAKYHGKDITYRVVEVPVKNADPEQAEAAAAYSPAIKETAPGVFEVTNTHEPATADLTVFKKWYDENDQDGLRPDSIVVCLRSDADDSLDADVGLSAANGWTYTYKDLPVYNKGKAIKYSFVEYMEGFDSEYNDEDPHGYPYIADTFEAEDIDLTEGLDAFIYNIHFPKRVNVEVKKTWNDENDHDKKRPTSLTYTLYANGAPKKTVTVEGDPQKEDSWNYSFEDLPKYDHGREIVYTVLENSIEGYTAKYNTTIETDIPVDSKTGEDIDIITVKITNSYEPGKTTITAVKRWDDDDNRDGKRPGSVNVKLGADNGTIDFPDGVEAEAVLNDENNWQCSWNVFSKDSNGKDLKFNVTETSKPNDYDVSYAETDGVWTVKNTYLPETVDVVVKKEWKDESNRDGIRPESVTMDLIGMASDKNVFSRTVTLQKSSDSDADVWKKTLFDLPKYADGEEITYLLTERVPSGYTADKKEYKAVTNNDNEEFTVVNTHEPERIDIDVKKVWDDADNQDGIRPRSIYVRLYAGGEHKRGEDLTLKGPSWSGTFENLYKYEKGKEIKYSVKESISKDGPAKSIPEYSTEITGNPEDGFTIKNTHEPATASITVVKNWEDYNNNDGFRPDSLQILLEDDGESIEQLKAMSASSGWTTVFEDLPVYRDGELIEYTVRELLGDWASRYEDNDEDVREVSGITLEEGDHVADLFNTHEPATVKINVTKIWDDDNNHDKKRPEEINITLFANGLAAGTLTDDEVDPAADEKDYDLGEYLLFLNGELLSYTIAEAPVKDYTTTYFAEVEEPEKEDDPYTINFTIKNKYEPGRTTITAVKEWNDDDNRDGIRPDGVEVQLKIDGSEKDPEGAAPVVLNEENNWQCSWDVYAKDPVTGNDLEYKVVETALIRGDEKVPVDAESGQADDGSYTATYAHTDGVWTVKNTHKPETIDIDVRKIWIDGNNWDGIRPSGIRLQLTADGKRVEGKELVLTGGDGYKWTGSFTDLPVYDKGNPITYSVLEEVFDGYRSEVTPYSTDSDSAPRIEILNYHRVATTNVTAHKIWDDNDDQDGLRDDAKKGLKLQLQSSVIGLENNAAENAAEEYREMMSNILDLVKDSDEFDTDYKDRIEEAVEKLLEELDAEVRENPKMEISLSDKELEDGTYEWTSLPVNYYGKKINYRVVEIVEDDPEKADENAQKAAKAYRSGIVETDPGVFEVTNTHEPATADIKVVKTWDDYNNNDGFRPDSLQIILEDDQGSAEQLEGMSAESGWTTVFEDLPVYRDGQLIKYTVGEVYGDWASQYEESKPDEQTEEDITLENGDHLTELINSHELLTCEMYVTKIWDDGGDHDDKRPENITFTLFADTLADETFTEKVSDKDTETYKLGEYLLFLKGDLLSYTIAEAPVEDYTTSYFTEVVEPKDDDDPFIINFIITNKYEPGRTTITAVKEWDDDDNRDGIRPDGVEVQLGADGSIEFPEGTDPNMLLNEENNWQCSWDVYTKEHGTGKDLEYKVAETALIRGETRVPVDKTGKAADGSYTASYAHTDGVWTVKNSHVPEKTDITVTKTWVDSGNWDGMRPASITLKLTANGKVVEGQELVLTEESELAGDGSEDEDEDEEEIAAPIWTGVFRDLPLKENGEFIEYSVIEEVPQGYNETVIPFYTEDYVPDSDTPPVIKLINLHAVESTSLKAYKKWNDGDDQDGIRNDAAQALKLQLHAVVDGEEFSIAELNNGQMDQYLKEIILVLDQSEGMSDDDKQEAINMMTVIITMLKILSEENPYFSYSLSPEDSSYDWGSLPAYYKGKKISYRVVEVVDEEASDDGKAAAKAYKSGIVETDPGIFEVTNTHEPEEISLSITKDWNDSNDRDGIRPEFAEVQVMKLVDGKSSKVGRPIRITGSDWTTIVSGLPKYERVMKDEESISLPVGYYVVESLIDGYVPSYILGENVFSADFGDDLTETAKKAANEEAAMKAVVNTSEGDDEKKDFDISISNFHDIALRFIVIRKEWNDNDDQDGMRPDAIYMDLLANNEQIESYRMSASDEDGTIISDDGNVWWKVLLLPSFEDGKKINYQVVEESIKDYSKEMVVRSLDRFELDGGKLPKEIDELGAGDDVTVVEFTNSHNPGETSIMVTKNWKDEDDADGIRPDSVVIDLTASVEGISDEVLDTYLKDAGVKTKITLNEGDMWTDVFAHLPMKYAGKDIVYGVVEEVPDNYQASYSEWADEGYITVTNTHVTERATHTVTIKWDDNNNQDGMRPAYVNVFLLKDGERVDNIPVTLSAANGWTYTWKNLLAGEYSTENEKIKDAEYSVEESEPLDPTMYEKVDSSTEKGNTIITNKYTPATMEVAGHKYWVDDSNQDGMRPESITINLYGNGELVDSKELTAEDAEEGNADSWKYSFTDLPRYKDGQLVNYTVSENGVENYTLRVNGYDLYNTYTPGKTFVSVIKLWDDMRNRDGVRPENIIVRLLANGEEVNRASISSASGWFTIFGDLDINKDGEAIEYTITEDEVEDYTSEITGDARAGFVVKNSHKSETVDITVKKVWKDNDNKDKRRPDSITVNLIVNGVKVDSHEMSSSEKWQTVFKDMPKYSEGKEVNYVVSEDVVDNYVTSVSGYTITNTLRDLCADLKGCIDCGNKSSSGSSSGGTTGTKTVSSSPAGSGAAVTSSAVKTGDNTKLYLLLIMMAASAAVMLLVYRRKIKSR